jgi:hypothetical protein
MRMVIGVVVVVGVVGAVTAREAEVPPARFDRAFAGKLTVQEVSAGQVERMCAAAGPRNSGCAFWDLGGAGGDRCTIVIAPEAELRAKGATRAGVLRHEIGHCNGWPAHHPR